jgi:hypothetical protein
MSSAARLVWLWNEVAEINMPRVGQSRIYIPSYMTVCLVISLPKIRYIQRI